MFKDDEAHIPQSDKNIAETSRTIVSKDIGVFPGQLINFLLWFTALRRAVRVLAYSI